MVRALQRLALSGSVGDDVAAVAAHVEEGTEVVVARACNYYGNLSRGGREVGAGLRDLPRMADVLPGAREDPLALAPQDLGIGVPRPGRGLSTRRNCSVRAVAVTKTRKQPLFEQFFAVRRFSSALAFTADGEQSLFASNISGQFNLWRVRVEGGWPDQLTAFTDETVRGVGVIADGRPHRVCADHDGDEFHQLYMLDAERRLAARR